MKTKLFLFPDNNKPMKTSLPHNPTHWTFKYKDNDSASCESLSPHVTVCVDVLTALSSVPEPCWRAPGLCSGGSSPRWWTSERGPAGHRSLLPPAAGPPDAAGNPLRFSAKETHKNASGYMWLLVQRVTAGPWAKSMDVFFFFFFLTDIAPEESA